MKSEVKMYELKLVNPFGISRSTRTSHTVVFLEVDNEFRGEASPYPYYGESIEGTIDIIEKAMEKIEGEDFFTIEWIMDELKKKFTLKGTGSAMAAIDMMLFDFSAKKSNLPLYKFLGYRHPEKKQTSFTIGIDSVDKMLKKVDDAAEHPILKIKLGRDVEQDLMVMKEIRKRTDKTIRVDANGGWTPENALRCINLLADLGIEYVEQPLVKGSFEELKKLKKNSPLPIFLDEDILVSNDIIKVLDCCDGINIKLMKCGGILEARRMISIAKSFGLKIMLGCMIESSLSVTAAAHLSSAVDYLDLDGNLLVANDPFDGMHLVNTFITLPNRNGIGVIPKNN